MSNNNSNLPTGQTSLSSTVPNTFTTYFIMHYAELHSLAIVCAENTWDSTLSRIEIIQENSNFLITLKIKSNRFQSFSVVVLLFYS